jgi:hypothetical protein
VVVELKFVRIYLLVVLKRTRGMEIDREDEIIVGTI